MSVLYCIPYTKPNKINMFKYRGLIAISILYIIALPIDGLSYDERRNEIIDKESNMAIGHDVILNDREKKANGYIMALKHGEYYDHGYTGNFPAQDSFIYSRDEINNSSVYKIIKRMPKGGVLHTHFGATVYADWIMNVTYRQHLYLGQPIDTTKRVMFAFRQNSSVLPATDGYTWTLMSDKRKAAANVNVFDAWLKSQLTLIVPTHGGNNESEHSKTWNNFFDKLFTCSDLLIYEPVFRDYHYQTLLECYKDNVQYIEIRDSLNLIHRLDGTLFSREEALLMYKEVNARFIQDHPDFSGAKIIQKAVEQCTYEESFESVKSAAILHQKYPDVHIGFDMVNTQEDSSHPIRFYLDALTYPSMEMGVKLPFFFHAGETLWQNTQVDENIVDAVLLNASRIGHAFAILRHPQALKIVKDKKIAIEVNPIANQVLGLVHDLRNHPMVHLIARDYPIVVSSDDYTLWNADVLSHDFYMAFMALSGKTSDIRMLKKLALNSIMYSGMDDQEKIKAENIYEHKWRQFIEDIISEQI